MRRFIAYICMAITVLISVGVAFTPVFTSMNPGREFTSGNEIVYRLSDKDSTDLEHDSDAAEDVAEEMRSRLETYKIEDYSVRVEGNDTVRVSLSVKNETQLNYISRYLCFNGKNFSLAGAEEETRLTQDKIFVDSTAYITKQDDIVPYVIFPVSDTAAVKTLIESVKGEDSEENSESLHHPLGKVDGDPDSDDEESSTPDIYLWANWEDGDSYEKAQNDKAITGQKIICQFVTDNIWYKEGLDEDEEPTSLQYLCGFADDSGSYDTSKLEEANELATYICNMFNASEFKYNVENLFVTQSSSGVTQNNITSKATAENLLVYGSDVNVAWSVTLIATLVAVAVVFLILVLFFRVGALGIAANTLGSTFLSYVIFMALGATFNIAAIVGGILIAASSLVVGVLYMNKLKEEVYKGRALRKANQEATKKIALPSLDIAVVTAFSGLMIYFLGGNALKPLGIILFFGALISLLMNLIIFRLMMWLLTNSASVQNNVKLLNLDEKLVPNIMKEEKPTYVAPYENTDFTKKKKPVAIVSGLVAIASIALITTFGILNGSPLNVSEATKNYTEVYTSIRSDNPTLSTEDSFKNDVLKNVFVDGKALSYSDVDLTNREEYDYETDITTKYTYFVTSIDGTFADTSKYAFANADGEKVDALDLEDAIFQRSSVIEGESSTDYIEVEAKVSHETVNTPHQGYVALASAISIVGACIYFAFRYRPSRGVAALVLSSATALVSYGLFVICRIQTTAVCSLVMPIAVVASLVASILFFEKEKELLKEKKGELTSEERKAISIKAASLSAAPLFISSIMAAYVSINYFGFGYKSFAAIFAGMLLAVCISALFTTTLLAPLSEGLSKLFKKIKLPTIKINHNKKQRIKLHSKPKTSEPEETIFIGIND